MRKMLFAAVLGLMGCDLIENANLVTALECTDICTKVDECGVVPPAPELPSYTGGSGIEGIDCAANCIQDDRAFYGYSDCQLECLSSEPCDKLAECWRARSDTYATYCLSDRNTVAVEPAADDPQPTNGSSSGSSDADTMLGDPACEIAIDEGDFDVNFGDDPPDITGLYRAVGSIDDAAGARPIGSVIDTQLCFWNQKLNPDGSETEYCEYFVPGIASAPVTGSGNDFTIYLEYPDVATLMFSGTVDGDGKVTEAETLVVYLYGIDMWEHSETTWSYEGACDGSCPSR
jgi:hypothetical protein